MDIINEINSLNNDYDFITNDQCIRLKEYLLSKIKQAYDEKIGYSSDDIIDIISEFMEQEFKINLSEIEDDEYDLFAGDVVDKFVRTSDVYVSFDKESYKSIIKNKDLISHREKEMNETINRYLSEGKKIIHRDTEFNIDNNGYYIIN
jgi:Na+/phosphate symporter